MKRYIRIIAICLLLLLGLCSCAQKADYAIKVGDRTVTENDYYRTVTLLRSNYLYSAGAEDTAETWSKVMDDGSTLSQVFKDYVEDYLVDAKLYAIQFDKLGLTFSESEENTIQTALAEAVEASGGMSAFVEEIGRSNYTYEEYLEEVYDSAKKSKVLKHYYGENGQDPVSLQDIKDYYNLHNALIKVCYVLKVDSSTGESLPANELAKAKQKAEDAYAAAIAPSDIDTFDDVISVYGASGSSTEPMVIPDNGSYDKELADPILDLEIGEVTLLDMDSSYMIVKRYDGTADDVFTATLQLQTLQTIRADDITAMLTQWREETTIKVNAKITKKYAPEKLIKE